MNRRTFCAILPGAGVLSRAEAADQPRPARERIAFDRDWRFLLGDPTGAEALSYDAGNWRMLDLPHDWSIEGKIDSANLTGGSEGFFPAGVGWYRRTFTAPMAWRNKRVSVAFEGVYMNATVYLNGHELGTHPYGYTSFSLDLTEHLNAGATNVVAVRVDQSKQQNSRWYSGSGIYRHVWLDIANPVHVVPWGISITTPEVSEGRATVRVRANLANHSARTAALMVRTTLFTPAGAVAGEPNGVVTVQPGDSADLTHEIVVNAPALWAPESPSLYRAVTRVLEGENAIDEVSTTFGIRSIRWSAENGFLLNGRSVKMVGCCVHHDNGPLGAVALDRAEERRVQILKDAGFNAIRASHNPPSPAFLDACDRLGMLVMDESFDCWSKPKKPFDYSVAFSDWWRRDLEAMVQRDRNHPSVVMWSIGNEVGERGEPLGAQEAKMLADYVRGLDSTRPVTAALNLVPTWTDTDEFFAALDIGGYNYNLSEHAEDHKRVPSRIIVCSESYPHSTFDDWTMVADFPYIIGSFVWTGIDYFGESGIGRWYYRDAKDTSRETYGAPYPCHGSDCGDIDICGFRKAISHYRNIVCDRGEKLFLGVRQPVPEGKDLHVTRWGVWPVYASWTWPGMEGKTLDVEVYSRGEAVRLYLGDRLVGEKPTSHAEQFRANFSVPYASGVLKAVALQRGKTIAESVLRTAGDASRLRLTADRSRLRADGQDLSFIAVEALDARGQPNPNANHPVTFAMKGPGAIAAVGNADMTSEEMYRGNQRKLYQGKGLVVVRTSRTAGSLALTATAPGLNPATIRLQSR